MLLKTKFFAPPTRENAIARERLLSKLGKPAPGQLSLIYAPAGYGKTTLTKQWLDKERCHYSWLSLDPQDNEATRFWRYFSTALGMPVPHTEHQGDSAAEHEQQLTHLLNHWQSATQDILHLLVLDDFHCIQDNDILQQLSWFLDRMPHSLHLVITSRTLPQLRIPRRRVRNQVTELQAHDLSFLAEETQDFLRDTLSLHLPAATIAALQRKTEGWAAALQLAGLSLQNDIQTADNWLQHNTNQSMMDYLAEEVLSNQPEDVQQFLLHVTQVRRFCLRLCEFALSDLPECQADHCIQYLQDNNVFLIPLDNDGRWFRFHELFRGNIQTTARKAIPHSLQIFLTQAAHWFVAEGDEEEAIYCLLQAELWHEAATLIEELGVSRMLAGQNDSLNWWLGRLPEHIILERPKLSLIKAWSLFCTERVIEAEPFLDQADITLSNSQHEPLNAPAHSQVLRTQILIFRTQIARFRGDDQQANYWSALALQHSEQERQQFNAVTQFAMGLELYQNGKQQATQSTLEQALKAAHEEHNYFGALSISVMLAHVNFQNGFTRHALSVLEQTRHWLLQNGQDPTHVARWQNIIYVAIYREMHQLEKAEQYMIPLTEYQQQGAESGHSALISLLRSSLFASHRQWHQALSETEHAIAILSQDQSHWSAMSPDANMIKALYQLHNGNEQQAQHWASQHESSLIQDARFATEEERIMLARCLGLQGRKRESLALLEKIIDETSLQGRLINKARALLTLTIVQIHLQELQMATQTLLRAFHASEPGHYQQMFFDEARFIEPVLQILKKQGTQGWWSAIQQPSQHTHPHAMVETLTSRELEVLNLIAIGHRNQAIADALHIALTTTKAHIRHIYEKMSVKSRTQAVAKGRELGIIH